MKLSDEQKAVIHAPLQAMAVTACAGSGKLPRQSADSSRFGKSSQITADGSCCCRFPMSL